MKTTPANNSANHLNDREMGCALVDRSDLADGRHRHLKNCVHCQAELKRMTLELQTLGRLAHETTVPSFSPAVIIAKRTADANQSRSSRWRPLVAAAVMVLVIAIWWADRGPFGRSPVTQTALETAVGLETLWQEIEQEQQLMAEIEALETAAVQWGLGEWAPESQEGSSDTFFEFLAPLEQEVAL